MNECVNCGAEDNPIIKRPKYFYIGGSRIPYNITDIEEGICLECLASGIERMKEIEGKLLCSVCELPQPRKQNKILKEALLEIDRVAKKHHSELLSRNVGVEEITHTLEYIGLTLARQALERVEGE